MTNPTTVHTQAMLDQLPVPVATLSDTALRAEYDASEGEAGDARCDALAGEIERRGLDL